MCTVFKQFAGSLGAAAKYGRFAVNAVRRQGLAYCAAEFAAEAAFDWRHRVRTLTPRELSGTSAPAEAAADGVQYQGASPRLVRALLSRLPASTAGAAFVDYGCGKGRGLLLGAEHGFRRLIGVEFAPELADDCRTNLARAGGASSSSEIHVMDAALFEPPPGPLVAFLYNPFQGATLARVAERLGRHAAVSGGVLVVYVNPVGLDAFVAAGFSVTHREERRGELLGAILRRGAFPD
jgi:hypothetical protein